MINVHNSCILLAAGVLAAALSLQAAPRQRVLSVAPGSISVDGKASPGEWPTEGARPMGCAIPVAGDVSQYSTEAWTAFDGTSLYMLIRVHVAPDNPLVMDGRWGNRDGLELAFRDPRDTTNPIVSALCYPDGTFEGQSVGGTLASPADLMENAMSYGATVDTAMWTAELAVPLPKVGIPTEGLERLNFNLNIRRMCDVTWMVWARTQGPVWAVDTAGRLLFGDTAENEEPPEEFVPQQISSVWEFRPDPENRGEHDNWATEEGSDEWENNRIDLRSGWGMAGFRHYAGWAWLRQSLSLPADIAATAHVWLFFPAVDEQCEVYLDGQKIAEHTVASTGLAPGQLWRDPILVDVTAAWKDRDARRRIALHVLAYSSTGGIRKPAFVLGTKEGKLTPSDAYQRLVNIGLLQPREQDLRVAEIPALPPHPAPETLGARIPRTMTLLATSTPNLRHHVKILFYGQSITAGMHWRQMMNTLRNRFPYAIIEAENRAIGGFTAPSLCRTALADLYTTDADLVLFHDYGGENTGELERMIETLRQVTTAEIMIYTHTVAWVDNPSGLAGRTRGDDNSAAFNRYLAQKYNCELVEAREEWREFLQVHEIGINEYMGDTVHSNVHPNSPGHTLLAALCQRHLQYNPYLPAGWANDVRWVEARRALEEPRSELQITGAWERDSYGVIARNGECTLTLPFDGSRVDLAPHPDIVAGTFTMTIDGKSPDQFPELFVCTKTDGIRPGDSWPVFKRVTLPQNQPPIPQTWTARVTSCDLQAKTFEYTVSGSVTGPDGTGSNQADFTSNSGQIRIEKRDCFLIWPLTYRKMTCPEDLAVTWDVVPRFQQPVRLGPAPGRNVDRRIVLFSGLRPGPHTLTLTWTGDAPAGIKALIVHQPPLN
jgi:hypothetical protein